MNMFGMETEGFDDESELEQSAARNRDDENMFGAQNISIQGKPFQLDSR